MNDARLFRLHQERIITAIVPDTMLGCIGVDHGHSHSHSTVLCGDMDMCIALRTAIVKDQKLYIQAGGGVVYDSDPEAEYMETVHKSNAIRRAAADAAMFASKPS